MIPIVLTPSSRALCCLPSVKKQKHFLFSISLYSMHKKQELDSELRFQEVFGRGYQPKPITFISTLIIISACDIIKSCAKHAHF